MTIKDLLTKFDEKSPIQHYSCKKDGWYSMIMIRHLEGRMTTIGIKWGDVILTGKLTKRIRFGQWYTLKRRRKNVMQENECQECQGRYMREGEGREGVRRKKGCECTMVLLQ